MGIETRIVYDDMDSKVGLFLKDIQDASRPLRQWAVEYGRKVAEAWGRITYGALYSGSVTFRGEVTWGSVGPQYVRKTDGVAVPPWGGVPRIRGEVLHVASVIATGKKIYGRAEKAYGNVKGKLRPSGKRVTSSSVFGADTNAMRRQFTTNPTLSADRKTVTLVTNAKQSERFNERAPFGFLTSSDRDSFRKHIADWLSGAAKKV